MARHLMQGDPLYILFDKEGESVFDSQNRPRMYKSVEAFQRAFPRGIDGVKLEKYVPCQQWISVQDGLPEDDKNLPFYDDGQLRFTSVLVRDKERGTAIANRLMIRHHSIPVFDELATDGWVWSRPYEPTHWMSLPEPPKELVK